MSIVQGQEVDKLVINLPIVKSNTYTELEEGRIKYIKLTKNHIEIYTYYELIVDVDGDKERGLNNFYLITDKSAFTNCSIGKSKGEEETANLMLFLSGGDEIRLVVPYSYFNTMVLLCKILFEFSRTGIIPEKAYELLKSTELCY